MGNNSTGSSKSISLPPGGGAQQGIGETFSPDLFTGTGNFTVPIAIPPGRNGFQPSLNLVYSSGNGNGVFGEGWQLGIPGVSRKTSKGVPQYLEANDIYTLSGAEDLVPVDGDVPGIVLYRPRTEGLFARIEYHRDADNSYWIVRSKDGLISTYGTPNRFGDDPAAIADPANRRNIFAWKLTETRDPFGNLILYEYERDQGEEGEGAWDQLYLSTIRYVDTDQSAPDGEGFLVAVNFLYEDRPDPFSNYRAGFQIRTTGRCHRIEIKTHAEQSLLVRRYQFIYLDQRVANPDNANSALIEIGGAFVESVPPEALPINGVSLLSQIRITGHDEALSDPENQTQALPPLEFDYSRFTPKERDFFPLQGRDLPAQALSSSTLELVDLFGNGLPDLIEMNGTVRYWRNLGAGKFDLPRMMNEAPAGLSFADSGVQIIDANGNGRADLLVNKPEMSGYFPIRFGGYWDRRSFQRYDVAPSFDLEGDDVALVDLDGDGVTDAIRSGNRMEYYFNDPIKGWGKTRRVARRPLDEFPNVNFSDPRVRFADMTGDGLQDIVLVHDGNIEYWPNLGHGNWGRRVHMRNSPRFPAQYDSRQILIGDVDGDGVADLIFVDHCKITLWINQSGNGFSEPIEIDGTPAFTNQDDVRLVDMLGTGVGGMLWSQSTLGSRRDRYYFLDFTGGIKPYVLNQMDNHRGAKTSVTYRSSTEEYLRDQATPETRWKTTLPFPVQVVFQVEIIDEFSRGRLVTEYRYHHGSWDGGEKEYLGFCCVEQIGTETFDRYYAAEETDAIDRVEPVHFSPPTLTKNWFHLGPVGDEFGGWEAVDHSDEFWPEDPTFFTAERAELNNFLGELEVRRDRRDALRTLRGTLIRSELYALDDNPLPLRPYTVSESVYGLDELEQPVDASDTRHRIFFPFLRAQRTTQWERGDDPHTQLSYTSDYDHYGQPRQQLQIACPRGWRNFENDALPATVYLTTYSESTFAQRDDFLQPNNVSLKLYIVDRGASSNSFQIFPPQNQNVPIVTVSQLKNQAFDGTAPRELIGQSFNYYDGEAFIGLPLDGLGDFGALVRSESLVTTEAIIADAYRGDDDNALATIPPYLEPDGGVNWPAEYPEPFRQLMPVMAGYRFNPGDVTHSRGYFVDTVRNRYDFQTPGIINPSGLLLATHDPLDRESVITFDNFGLLPETVTDPVGLTITADNNYRVLQPFLVTDPNGNRTQVDFSPLGLPLWIAVMGKEGEPVGDTPENPGTRFEYDLLAYDNSSPDERQPVFVHTIRRVHHINDTHIPVDERGDTIESREYSDGFGRLLQTRAQAEDELFGDNVFGNNTLTPDQNDAAGTRQPVIGRSRDSADPPNVVVSGWQIYDNKGQVVEQFEPFYDTSYDYLSLREALQQRNDDIRDLFGRRIQQFYDPRGQVIRTLNPDGSEQRVIYGVLSDLNNPDNFDPTPWEAYTYDANDLAPLSAGRDDDNNPVPLIESAPVSHHFTPASIRIDSLGRTVESIQRNRDEPAAANAPLPPIEEIRTESRYDIRGNLLTVIDALGRSAFEYTYDLANNALRVFSIDAGTKRTVLDALGNAIEQRDSKQALILSAYDNLNRPTDLWARDDAEQAVTLRQHLVYGDNAGEIGMNRMAAINNNVLGKLVKHYDEAGVVIAGVADFKGNLLEKTRQVISDQELLSVFNGVNNGADTAYQVDWQPDGISITAHAAAILDATEYTTSSRYDGLNRIREADYPRDVDNERKTLIPHYNRAGALESVTLDNDTYVERITYNAKGQRTLIAYGNGIMTRYAYDPLTFRLQRLHSGRFSHPQSDDLVFQAHGEALQDYGYDYDLVGNITEIFDRTLASGVLNNPETLLVNNDPVLSQLLISGNALNRRFSYDPVYRLISATGREHDRPPDNPPWLDRPKTQDMTATRRYTQRYEYDLTGNMLNLRHDANDATLFNRTYNVETENNRLHHMSIGAMLLDYDYDYDAAGNMTSEHTNRHFLWNHSNQMKAFIDRPENSDATVNALYLYDAAGIRVKKLVRNQGGGFRTTTYIDEAFEHHRRVTASQNLENNKLHVMDDQSRVALVRVGVAFSDDRMPEVQFQIGDHLGSSNVVVGENGSMLNREEYMPYGETSFGGGGSKRFRFTGKERDEESGLNYHKARYYVSWLGQWISSDPKGTIDGLNTFTYSHNNPIALIDLTGLLATEPPTSGTLPKASSDENEFSDARDKAVENLYPNGNLGIREFEEDTFLKIPKDFKVKEAVDLKNSFNLMYENLDRDVAVRIAQYYASDDNFQHANGVHADFAQTKNGLFWGATTKIEMDVIYGQMSSRIAQDNMPKIDITNEKQRVIFISAILLHEYLHVLQGSSLGSTKEEADAWAVTFWYLKQVGGHKHLEQYALNLVGQGGIYEAGIESWFSTLEKINKNSAKNTTHKVLTDIIDPGLFSGRWANISEQKKGFQQALEETTRFPSFTIKF